MSKLEAANEKVEIKDLDKTHMSECVTICPRFDIGGIAYTCIVFTVPVLVGHEPTGPVYRHELRGPVIIPIDKLKEPSFIEVING